CERLRHDPRIVLDHSSRRIVLAVDRKLYLIRADFQRCTEVKTAEATASAAEATKSCRRSNGFTAKIPLHTIEAHLFRARNRAHHFAGVITNRNLHVGCRNCFQVVTDRSPRRWVGAAKVLRSTRVPAQPNVVVPEPARANV